jgi:hypothetical protein
MGKVVKYTNPSRQLWLNGIILLDGIFHEFV